MTFRPVPFVDPNITEDEIAAVSEVLKSKNLVEGNRVRSFESKFADFCGTKYAIACTNGTVALHLAMETSPLKPGDEILTTPFTFIATSNSILFTGAVPKFVDIDPLTWNLDPKQVEENITDKTKAIMPVHIFGLAADMPYFRDLAEDNNLFLIEDAAQAHGAQINDKHVGGFGDVATFSLYATKNLISGEGGIITTDNEDLKDEIISVKNHGRTPKGGYTHDRVGYNGRMSDVIGAIADIQMDRLPAMLEKRKMAANKYRKVVDEIEKLDYQRIPNGFEHGNYIFALDTRKHEKKPTEAIKELRELGVLSRPIYSTLSYQQNNFKNINNWRWSEFVNYPNYNETECQIAEEISVNHFEIPIVPSLSDEEIEKVENAIIDVFG
ncbi:MAG: DegT/DnrJ/EryC1/StrS family aminotransferase [Candidatus Kariarchaeaceae archaeon]|jgi:dTDP-4-amino-4,6-dideoxygalactose transaminase